MKKNYIIFYILEKGKNIVYQGYSKKEKNACAGKLKPGEKISEYQFVINKDGFLGISENFWDYYGKAEESNLITIVNKEIVQNLKKFLQEKC